MTNKRSELARANQTFSNRAIRKDLETGDTYPSVTSTTETTFGKLQRRSRYTIVGATGFLVDAGLLSLLVHIFSLDPIISRVPSFTAAVTVTWILNRAYTFVGRSRYNKGTEYRRYICAQIAGATTNLLIYILLIAVVPWLGEAPVFPLSIGAVAGLIVNYKLSCVYVFPEQEIEHGK